MYLVKKIGSDT